MKHFARLAAIVALAISIGACAQLKSFESSVENAVSVATSAAVTPKDAYVAINVYDGVEATATNYNRWPRCTGVNSPCRDPAVRAQIKKIVLAGRVARNQLKAYLRANPGESVSIGSFADLRAATSALQDVINTYKIS
jgi:hypothetical protein